MCILWRIEKQDDKPYTRLQSQGNVKWPTIEASLMLIARLFSGGKIPT